MNESLLQSFAVIGLNGQRSNYNTVPKTITMRVASSAIILDIYLNGKFDNINGKLNLKRESVEGLGLDKFQKLLLYHLLNRKEELSYTLEGWLKAAASTSRRFQNKLEKVIAADLLKVDFMEEIPSLLGCDLLYDSSGISLREYRANEKTYIKEISQIKMELLEDGQLTEESICMFWLLRESAALKEVFSEEELRVARINLDAYDLLHPNSLLRTLFPVKVHDTILVGIKNYLRIKKQIMSSKVGSGLSFVFPPVERSESIFIEIEEGFSNEVKRLENLKNRLISQGHHFTVLKEGQVPVIRINNIVYYATPTAVVVSHVPVQGMRLRRRVI